MSVSVLLLTVGLGIAASSSVASKADVIRTNPPIEVAQSTSFSWNVSVGFECKDGRCYFNADAGISYSRSDAQRQIDAAIRMMIQQEIRKGAKPTGQVNTNIKENR